jgi:hypothetical protein
MRKARIAIVLLLGIILVATIPLGISNIGAAADTHTWAFCSSGFFPKHLSDSYYGSVQLGDLADVPSDVQGVYWYDCNAMEWKFWARGAPGCTLTTLGGGHTYDYMVTVTGSCNWEVPLSSSIPTPTTTPTPTPTPTTTPTTPLGYSRSNPAGMNYHLSIWCTSTGSVSPYGGNDYEVRITLTDLITGNQAWQLIQDANMFNDPPETGFEYILAMIRFEYLTGPTPDTTYWATSYDFDAISSTGKEYDMPFVVEPDPSLDADLYPGASHEGWAAFEVAIDDSKPLMTFGRYSDGTGGLWWKLY